MEDCDVTLGGKEYQGKILNTTIVALTEDSMVA